MSVLFSPMRLGRMELPNRIFIAPMCQYSAVDGVAGDWHWQHVGSLAVSAAAAMTLEATAVAPEGRITHGDLGLYTDAQEAALRELVGYVRRISPINLGVQLSHAGRKASCYPPWRGGQGLGTDGWGIVGPSAIAFGPGRSVPVELDEESLEKTAAAFVAAARRANQTGLDYVELHLAHGYLLSSFLSPISNQRRDRYGGSLENRMRFPVDVVARVRQAWPAGKPLGVRINCHDWIEDGIGIEEMVRVCLALKEIGIDFVCVSAGATAAGVRIPAQPGYLAGFAETIRARTGIVTRAVGMIYDPALAESILAKGQADCVAIGRAMLDDPRWAIKAAWSLGEASLLPEQYSLCHPAVWRRPAPQHLQEKEA